MREQSYYNNISQEIIEEHLLTYETNNEECVYIKEHLEDVFNIISLFSGGSGMLDYPFCKDNMFNIVKAIEYNKSACESYKYNIGDVVENKNVKDVEFEDNRPYNILIGGVSCKPFSNANRIKRLE